MSDEGSGLYEISDEDLQRDKKAEKKVVGIFAREVRKQGESIQERETNLIGILMELEGVSRDDIDAWARFEAREKGFEYLENWVTAGMDSAFDFKKLRRSDEEIKENITRLEQQITRIRMERGRGA